MRFLNTVWPTEHLVVQSSAQDQMSLASYFLTKVAFLALTGHGVIMAMIKYRASGALGDKVCTFKIGANSVCLQGKRNFNLILSEKKLWHGTASSHSDDGLRNPETSAYIRNALRHI